jgi:hypothetical protein
VTVETLKRLEVHPMTSLEEDHLHQKMVPAAAVWLPRLSA